MGMNNMMIIIMIDDDECIIKMMMMIEMNKIGTCDQAAEPWYEGLVYRPTPAGSSTAFDKLFWFQLTWFNDFNGGENAISLQLICNPFIRWVNVHNFQRYTIFDKLYIWMMRSVVMMTYLSCESGLLGGVVLCQLARKTWTSIFVCCLCSSHDLISLWKRRTSSPASPLSVSSWGTWR